MATHLEHLLQKFETNINKIKELTRRDYTADDVKKLAISCGSEFEIFLKLGAFPTKNQRHNFVQFIDELKTVGVSQPDLDVFHELRGAYNTSKHDPTYDPKLLEVEDLMVRVKKSIGKLTTYAFGNIATQVPIRHRRVLWVFAWDHFTSGDTEISIMFPSAGDEFPPSLDDICVDISAWEAIKNELATVGSIAFGKELFPLHIYDYFSNEGDFLAGGVFEGEYKDLLKTLAKYELRQDLLPGLNRHDSPFSMLQASTLAMVEVAHSFYTEPSIETLQVSVTDSSVNNYAVPADYKLMPRFVYSLATMLKQLDFSLWKAVTGPTWISKEPFSNAINDALALDEELRILIDKNCIVRIKISI
jgi:hypothetical protein